MIISRITIIQWIITKILTSITSSSASNRIIHAKDHASIQINLVDVDEATGRMTDTCKTYAICGEIRRMGESDDCIARLAKKDGVLSRNY
jgi:small subunit ribosomal protein S21e